MNFGALNPLWPGYRLVAAGWVALDGLGALTLDDILDACDVLDEVERARRSST